MRSMHGTAGWWGVAVTLALSSTAAPARAQTVSDPALTVSTVTTGLALPTTMAFVAANDMLVLQKNDGRVRRIVGGVLQPGHVLDVNVNGSSERGLLGIAVNSENPPAVFLYFTEATGGDNGAPIANRVYRYVWNGAAGVLQSPQLILDLPVTTGPNHNGGVLLLGPLPPPGPGQVGDGRLLYAVIGDLNRNGQLENFPGGPAPDDTAVILRVQQDGTAAPGNPFVPYCSATTAQACPTGGGCPAGETCRSEVSRYFAYGVRNSFGLALDPVSGDLWDTENGPGSYDEVNRVAPGFNSGWEQIMGPDSRDAQNVSDLFTMPGGAAAYSDPEFSWLSTVAPTAIVFPSGSALGAPYDAVALVGDNNTGQIYRFPLNATRTGFALSSFTGLADLVADSAAERDQLAIGSGFGVVTDLKIGPDGALYVVSLSSGAVYRIARSTPASTPTASPTATVPPAFTPTRTPTRTATRTATAARTATMTRTPTAPLAPTCVTFSSGICCTAGDGTNCRTPIVPCNANSQCAGRAPFTTCAGAPAHDGVAHKLNSSVYPPATAAGFNTAYTSSSVRRALTNGTYSEQLLLVRWLTAALPDTAVVTAATLRFDLTAKNDADGLRLTGQWYDWSPAIDASDYTALNGTDALDVPIASLPPPVTTAALPLSGLGAISRTGYTHLRLGISQRAGNAPPTGHNDVAVRMFENQTGAGPALQVCYTP